MPTDHRKAAREAAHSRIYAERVAANAAAVQVTPEVQAFLDQAKAKRKTAPTAAAEPGATGLTMQITGAAGAEPTKSPRPRKP